MKPVSATVLALALFAFPLSPREDEGRPVSGQPAADVLASRDIWGNPTFIGGLTNSGPNSHSVW